MKKTEFFMLFESILNKLPHTDLLQAMKYLEKLVDENLSPDPSFFAPVHRSSPPEQLPNGRTLLEELQQVEPDHLASYIKNSVLWKHKNNLMAFATELGITYPSKITKDKLLSQIVNHLRIRQMPAALHAYSLQDQR